MGFPEIIGTFLGISITGIIVLWGLNYHVGVKGGYMVYGKLSPKFSTLSPYIYINRDMRT